MRRRTFVLATLHSAFAAIVLMRAACAAADLPAQGEVFRAVMDQDGVQRVRILAGSYFFRPSHVLVKANTRVELSIRVEPGIVPHTFVIQAPEAGIAIDESLGVEARVIFFTPKASGKYPFYCRNKLLFFESHRERGMEGVLEVVE